MLYFRKWIPEEQADTHKQAHDAALKVLAYGLQKEYGIDRLPQIRCEAYGKPVFEELPDIRFNYSHCKTAILCGITAETIGVDIEPKGRMIKEALIAHVCCEAETVYVREQEDAGRAFLRIWVAKEAYLKYLGVGIRADLKILDMSAIAREGNGCYKECYLYIEETEDYVYAVCMSKNEDNRKMLLCEM